MIVAACAVADRALRNSAGIIAALLVACLVASLAAAPATAQEFFAARRGFVIDKACDAYGSFKRKSNPTPLVVGRTYAARGVNKRDAASHAFIVIPADGNKWVDLACGHFADGAGAHTDGAGAHSDGAAANSGGAATPVPPLPPKDARAGAAAPGACLPFFDSVDNPVKVKVGGKVDLSPPAPALDAFDHALTAACGAPGKVVAADELKALLGAHPDVTRRIMAFTVGKVFADRPARTDTAAYVDDLAEAWFALKAFDHILCGEPGTGSGKIGGMHFHARYLQLQNSGEACLMGNYSQNEVVPGVLYTTGVVMRLADGRVIRDARKGYGLTLGGEDLLKLVTRAFAENPTARTDSTACLLPVRDDGKSFTAVFVRRAAGIRTFYPDATPSPREPKCAAAISLQ